MRVSRPAAAQSSVPGHRPGSVSIVGRRTSRSVDARRQGWLRQKKDKPGEGEAAAEQDGPVPHIKAKKSTVRHDGDEL